MMLAARCWRCGQPRVLDRIRVTCSRGLVQCWPSMPFFSRPVRRMSASGGDADRQQLRCMRQDGLMSAAGLMAVCIVSVSSRRRDLRCAPMLGQTLLHPLLSQTREGTARTQRVRGGHSFLCHRACAMLVLHIPLGRVEARRLPLDPASHRCRRCTRCGG